MLASTVFFSLGTIVAPVLVVLFTDSRCLYNDPSKTTTVVGIEYCSIFDTTASRTTCTVFSTSFYNSTFYPTFDYDGGRCTSAVISTYAPVFLSSTLLAATLPAGLEIFVVPRLAPWCHRRSTASPMARGLLRALQATTWTVSASLAEADLAKLDNGAVDNAAEVIVARGLSQLLGTLLVALTFGAAAPVVGASCALAACVQLVHHQHLLGQLVRVGLAQTPSRVPNLRGCTNVGAQSAAVVAATALLAWGWAAVGFLRPLPLLVGAAAALGAAALLVGCASRFFSKQRRARLEWQRRRGVSGGLAASLKGLLLEPVLEDQTGAGED